MTAHPGRRRLLAAAGALALGGLAGCASLGAAGTAALRSAPPAGLPRRVELGATPFHPQEDYQCGPAALAMALGAAGLATSPEQLARQIFLPGREGTLQIEMLAGARRNSREDVVHLGERTLVGQRAEDRGAVAAPGGLVGEEAR